MRITFPKNSGQKYVGTIKIKILAKLLSQHDC